MTARSSGTTHLLLIGAVAWAMTWSPQAGAQGKPDDGVTTEGSTVDGEFAQGETVRVALRLGHPESWQRIQSVEVALRLRGRVLDQILLNTSYLSVELVGDGPPASFGEPAALRGSFVALDAERMRVKAAEKTLEIGFPLRLLEKPPAGARFYVSVRAAGVPATGYVPLAPPVEAEDSGFGWGTLGVAIAAALFLGGFVGNLFSSRRRPARGAPSVYAAVQRRITEDRSRS